MKFNVRNVLPSNTAAFNGFPAIRWLTVPFLVVVIVRSCVHLFSADGGAQSIAGIDIAVEGGNNIVALFHQWGAIQLILALVLDARNVNNYPARRCAQCARFCCGAGALRGLAS